MYYQAHNKDATLEPPLADIVGYKLFVMSVSQCQMKDVTMVDNPGNWLKTSWKILSLTVKNQKIGGLYCKLR